ncbi:type II toxin-antitoxin system PrlF family antitoxin [Rivularia sp. UHCC 0363]|uniref:type II toxin-antitoxin system PrlF family antitoxin n=1 Tax=Rivularia sp. UHCC 0363 TaxID=3110244 RepID=UPI002B1FD765|nr:type II toxin-antitoxin system PrlF family antitoxin [Rivularia sp. UHCC 0363]MEA5597840.1 type II toxin-antitoxin system PrlF family antitoxin [Rivularia sp. UHCC 0363]
MTERLNFQAESTLTDRYQTTVPENVRKALRLNKRDKIHYIIEPNGQVIMSRVEQEDPVLGKFLNFLAQDMSQNPQNIKPINSDLFNRTQSLIDRIELDLDATLSDEDE